MKTQSYLRLLFIILVTSSAFAIHEEKQSAQCIVISGEAYTSQSAFVTSKLTNIQLDFWKIDDEF